MFEFWFQIPSKTCTVPFVRAHIASDFTCVYCAADGTIFRATDVYELVFSYLSISIFSFTHIKNILILFLMNEVILKSLQTHKFLLRNIVYMVNKFLLLPIDNASNLNWS